MLTKSAVLYGPGKVVVEQFDLTRNSPSDGILRVEATGVCGTDIAAYQGTFNEYVVPRVLGHEVIGTIHELGDEASAKWEVQPGDRVAIEEYLPCGTCPACLSGAYTTCGAPKYGSRGVVSQPSVWGAYSEFMYLSPRSIVHRVPDHVSPVTAQLYIPIANGLHWVQEVAQFRAGGTIVILGPGAHGLGSVVAAKETGAENIVLVGLKSDAHRLEVGRRLGATATLYADDNVDVVTQLADLTGGKMADAIINLAPSPDALGNSILMAAERATIVHGAIGGSAGEISIPADRILRKTLTVVGVRGRPASASKAAIGLIASGRYPLEIVNTHKYTVDEIHDALESSTHNTDVVRAVVVPDGANF